MASLLSVLFLVLLAGCGRGTPHYLVTDLSVGQPAFARAMEAHTMSAIVGGNQVRLLQNGDEIFPAMLEAIRSARSTITFANFMYEDGDIAREMTDALAERCRAGVGVNVLLDAVGSSGIPAAYKQLMRDAGCHVTLFHSLNPFAVKRINHRNHRRILVVDGRVGFTGGTGVGRKWTGNGREAGHWRQTDVRVEGPIVRSLQAAFAENWRDTTGILLGGDAYFPDLAPRGQTTAQSVKSSPRGGSAETYTLFLLSIQSARSSIFITSPYYVPDEVMAAALVKAAARGVRVSLMVAGRAAPVLDWLVRRASQAAFGRALDGGVKIYEYGPAYLHTKTMVVDGVWSTVGSANFDNRSFAINHELNLTFQDPAVARQLEETFREDLAFARELSQKGWAGRGLTYRFLELFFIPLKDQL